MNEDNNQYEFELDVPLFIELKSSIHTKNDYGAFTKINLKQDQFVGSFKGKIKKTLPQDTDLTYVWTIFSSRNVPLFYIDGSDPNDSNWVRFIRSTNDPNKQNIVCMQQNQQINYFTSKEIKPGDELLAYFYEKKKKIKRANKPDDSTISTRTRSSLQQKMKSSENSSSNPIQTQSSTISTSLSRTRICFFCKKYFDQRVCLCEHSTLTEQNLKLLKKKKEIRKKRWRDAHWKRKIDLSYIETTSLMQSSQNISDNLSFCIDGTHEDLRAYSKEVKNYLNSEVGTETQVQMFLKCCFPDVYKKLAAVPSALLNIDANLINKSNSYFIDIIYTPTKPIDLPCSSLLAKSQFTLLNSTLNSQVYNCKNCKLKCFSMTDLIKHHQDMHNTIFRTTFDCFNQNDFQYWSTIDENSNSPIGYFGCDPFAYVFNLHWDQTLEFKCSKCALKFSRPKFAKHLNECQKENIDSTNNKDINNNTININTNHHLNQVVDSSPQIENCLLICYQLIDNMISKIESNQIECRPNTPEPQTNNLSSDYRILNEQLSISSEKIKRAYKRKLETNKKIVNNLLNSNETLNSHEDTNDLLSSKKSRSRDYRVTSLINRKIYECEKCALEFTSSNSVIRHQEKSCLRVKVINLTSELKIDDEIHVINKKKCPICNAIFFNTHRLSIHIYKHHGSLLGSAALPPAIEAVNQLNNNTNSINNNIIKSRNNNRSINEDADVDIVYYE